MKIQLELTANQLQHLLELVIDKQDAINNQSDKNKDNLELNKILSSEYSRLDAIRLSIINHKVKS